MSQMEPKLSANTSKHVRQLSHVKFVKHTNTESRYPPSSLIITLEDTVKEPPKQSDAKDIFLNKICLHPSTEQGYHWPLFTYIWLAILILFFAGELLLNKQNSGEFFELNPINSMVGPSVESMIQTGARFAPCMKPISDMPASDLYVCLKTTTLNETLNLLTPSAPHWINSSCSLAQICGMTSFHQSGIPDQTVRFITPLVIHSGIIHLCLNVIILLVLGIKLEKAINPLRTSFLFISSGLFGHALGANFAMPLVAYIGCSSSFFGYLGYFHVDTIIHWKSIKQRIQHLIKLSLVTILCFLLGLLPGVDSFSHLGGFLSGIILAFLLIPIKEKTLNMKKLVGIYLVKISSLFVYAVLLGVLLHRFNTLE